MKPVIRFGTDGIRDLAGHGMCTAEVALSIGRAAARLARQHDGDTVLLARDTRPSGPMLARAVAAGVAAAGARAVDLGVLPTAGLMVNLADGVGTVGVMVTASHNPQLDNGFKVLGPGGHKLGDADNARFEDWLAEAPAPATPGTVETKPLAAVRRYQEALAACTPSPEALAGRRIGVDLANGAALATAGWLVERYPGVQWSFIGTGGGVINDGVGSEHPQRLCELVRAEGCHAGFAVDGDADRCVLVDETGAVVPGDALAWLLARGAGVDELAVTVMSNAALEPSLPAVRVVRTAVGDRHLRAAMLLDGIPLGCEESGHVLFDDALPGGDGVVTGLRALAYGLADQRLSASLLAFTPFPRVKGKVRVRHRPPLDQVPGLAALCRLGEERLGAGGRVFLRYSGTEPVLRVLVEGPVASTVESVARDITRAATEALA